MLQLLKNWRSFLLMQNLLRCWQERRMLLTSSAWVSGVDMSLEMRDRAERLAAGGALL